MLLNDRLERKTSVKDGENGGRKEGTKGWKQEGRGIGVTGGGLRSLWLSVGKESRNCYRHDRRTLPERVTTDGPNEGMEKVQKLVYRGITPDGTGRMNLTSDTSRNE